MIDSVTQKKILKAVGFKGRKVIVEAFRPMSLNSYWDSGSRDYFHFVDLNTFQVRTVPQNGTPFDHKNLKADTLEANTVLVETSIFQGKSTAARIYFNQ